jgi:hypothetical protein
MNKLARGLATSILILVAASISLLESEPGAKATIRSGMSEVAGSAPAFSRHALPGLQPGYIHAGLSDGIELGLFTTGVFNLSSAERLDVAALTWNIPQGVVIRRIATGPGLIWVRQGGILMSVRGELAQLSRGDRVVVYDGWHFELEADGDLARVSFLWLESPPPTTTVNDDGASGVGTISQPSGRPSFWIQNNSAADREAGIDTWKLAYAPAGVIPEGEVRAFLGFLTWTQSDSEFVLDANPGPTGLYVTSGSVVVNGRTRLDQFECALSPGGASLRIEGDVETQILLFGLEPMSGGPIGAELRFNNC